jgi:hypothetical protein
MEEVKDQLDSELRDLGFKPGDYQAEWRTLAKQNAEKAWMLYDDLNE